MKVTIILSKTNKRQYLKTLLILLTLFTSSLLALSNQPFQGGVAVINIGEFEQKPKVFFKAREVKVLQKDGDYIAVIGIAIDEKAGEKHIVAVTKKKKEHIYFDVDAKSYKKEYIKLKTNKRVTLSKTDLQRFQKEKKKTKKILKSFNKNISSNLEFISPLSGRISSTFGKKRYYNGKAKSPHKGTDIAAKRGTPIVASLGGKVVLRKDLFFNGNTIYLDHGEGVITMYSHMQKFAVNDGDDIQKGDVIGYVGTTGRSTGPHLHFGIILNGEAIDPGVFIGDYR